MAILVSFGEGGYRFISGAFQYSGGVCAEPGYEIERVRFRRWLPLNAGFAAIRKYLGGLGRPLTALCACELRSPAPFTEAGFTAFNREYIKPLEQWGIYRNGVNPIARSNVCPEVEPPAEPSFYAFSYTVLVPSGATPAHPRRSRSFVISGSGEMPDGPGATTANAVRLRDRSPGGIRAKAEFVLDEMTRRMEVFGLGWSDITEAQLYTVYDVHPLLKDLLAARGAMRGGLSWHFARPPLVDLDYEMDVRGVAAERVL